MPKKFPSMRFNSVSEINDFVGVVKSAKGSVWIEHGDDVLQIKSSLSMYVAIADMINSGACLCCDDEDDENMFYKFFTEHPQVII